MIFIFSSMVSRTYKDSSCHFVQECLGFRKDHTRNMYNITHRHRALGNTFSVYTVAYHFSVLKPLYPHGIRVLSLFSGVGGAEVALHKIGINLNVVVSVENEDPNRQCLHAWWQAYQPGDILNQEYHDVTLLRREEISSLVDRYGGFDLIVGGSPCIDLSLNNFGPVRTGLEGKDSSLFFEFSRIVHTVRELVGVRNRH